MGYSSDNYEIVYTLEEAGIYYAFNMNTSDLLIKDVQRALDELKIEGEYQKVIKKI